MFCCLTFPNHWLYFPSGTGIGGGASSWQGAGTRKRIACLWAPSASAPPRGLPTSLDSNVPISPNGTVLPIGFVFCYSCNDLWWVSTPKSQKVFLLNVMVNELALPTLFFSIDDNEELAHISQSHDWLTLFSALSCCISRCFQYSRS